MTVDFESDDDAGRSPLANGRAVASPGAFARGMTLSTSGPNLGPCVFDSTPDGPNGGTRGSHGDPDLLVDRGNVLVLQDSAHPAQTVPGRFDRPGDDPEGGVLRFEFGARVEPRSLALVDLDAVPDVGGRPDATFQVILMDEAKRRRVFRVPRGWTRDVVRDGPPGAATLDLGSLAPQKGFAAYATAREEAGFDLSSVMHIEVRMAGSGALDDLVLDPHPE